MVNRQHQASVEPLIPRESLNCAASDLVWVYPRVRVCE